MKWLITGGAGFIGTNAAALPVNAGDECVVADNLLRASLRFAAHTQGRWTRACVLAAAWLSDMRRGRRPLNPSAFAAQFYPEPVRVDL